MISLVDVGDHQGLPASLSLVGSRSGSFLREGREVLRERLVHCAGFLHRAR